MITHSLYRVLFLALAYHVVNVFSLPGPFRPHSVQSTVRDDMARWPPEPAHLEHRAAAPMDAPTGAPAGQSMYNEEAANSTTIEPGVIPNPSLSREQVNCTDLSTGRDNKCWNELNLTSWVENWIIYNPCYENEGFSSCFLREVGYPQLDCTGVKLATCTPPPVIPDDDTRKFYVAYNIYGMNTSRGRVDTWLTFGSIAINQFFGSWYSAVGGAATTAGLNVDAIVQLIDPPSDTTLILDDILLTLTGIFAVAPGLGFNVGNIIDHAVEDAEKVSQSLRQGLTFVENAIIGFPQIGRFLYPIDTPASSIIQMADLKNQLSDLIVTVQSNLNKTVSSVMSDVTEFLAFASQGNFTASAPSLPDETQYLLYAFNTYIISTGLRGNNIYGIIAKDTNVQSLATNGSQNTLAYDLSDCQGYNSENVCDTWWYSGNYASTFGLDDFSHIERGYGDVMTQLFQKYTTGQLLFDNAYGCNLNGNYGKPVSVTVTPQGINTQCLSQLRVLTWDMSCSDINRQCEFVEQGPQGQFLGNCGSQSYFSVMDEPIYCVPNSYLGPLINQRQYKLQRT